MPVDPESPNFTSPGMVKRSLAFDDTGTLPEQLSRLQLQLEEQMNRANEAAAQAAQANAETQALRAVVSSLETQVRSMPRSPGIPSVASPEAASAHSNPGMLILDVLGVLWLRDAVTGNLNKKE